MIGNFLEVNECFCRMTGYSKKEILTLQIKDIEYIEDREETHKHLKKVLEKGDDLFETRHLRKDGTIYEAEVSATFFEQNGGKIVGFCRDITERKKTETYLQNSQRLDSLGVLAGGIAHDFNNLLATFFGNVELARELCHDERVIKTLSRSLASLERAKNLTSQLLTFAKGGSPIFVKLPLFPFLEETVRFALSGTKVTCNFIIPEDLWVCSFDKNQLSQVFDNLAINAAQAMPQGGSVEISAVNHRQEIHNLHGLPPGKYVRISFRDTGNGILPEFIPKIFDPFFTTKALGHGLGLATCYSIMKRHKGTIEVNSIIGKGTVFNLYIPASEEVLTQEVELKNPIQIEGNILILDDQESVGMVLVGQIQSLGYRTHYVTNTKDAVDYIQSELTCGRSPVALLIDLTLPGDIDGVEFLKKIRTLNCNVPALVTSGYADDPVMSQPECYGFSDSIIKPFLRAELEKKLNLALSQCT